MSDYAPDERHGGCVLLRHLVSEFPKQTFCWLSSRPLRSGNMPAGFEDIPFLHADYTINRPNRLGLASWREYFNLRWLALLQARKAAAWAAAWGVKAVWVVMQEQMIVSGPAAARLLGVPYHASVHDLPSYLLRGRLGETKLRWFEAVFRANYRLAASRDVIWEPMRSHFRETTGSDALLVAQGVENIEKALAEPVRAPTGSPLKIWSTGMVYDAKLLGRFIEALEEERRAGRFPSFEFQLFGSEDFKPVLAPWPESVQWLGWVPEPDLAARMAEADFFYLQHPFDEARREFAQTSFPTKLPGYLQARRPILIHAPEYSSIAGFARRHQLPFCLPEISEAAAARTFGGMLESVPLQPGWAAGYDCALQELDWHRTAGQFRETIGRLGQNDGARSV